MLILGQGKAQSPKVNFEINPGALLENADILSLTSLGIDKSGAGPVLISGILENLTGDLLENLYFEIDVTASRYGIIVELDQNAGNPFSLDPFQSIYATNNDLAAERIPGIEEQISFSGGLTPEGEEFVNNLEGSTTLPTDIYTVQITLYQVTASGRTGLSTVIAEIGKAKTFEAAEIYLKSPGDVIGSGAFITSDFPQFSWEGEAGTRYRLLVVQNNGQDSPESLMESAKSSPSPGQGGSLLSFENLDVQVEGDSYQFPASGAQKLEPNREYFWRVLTTLQTSSGTEERSSEIWSFRLAAQENEGTVQVPMSDDVNEAITLLLGGSQFSELAEQGFALEGIEIDGMTLTGPAAARMLEEILRKIRDGKIVLADD